VQGICAGGKGMTSCRHHNVHVSPSHALYGCCTASAEPDALYSQSAQFADTADCRCNSEVLGAAARSGILGWQSQKEQ